MGSIYTKRIAHLHICLRSQPSSHYVRSGDGEFTITIKERIVDGEASVKALKLVNQFIDEHEEEIMTIWDKAQRGEKIQKIER